MELFENVFTSDLLCMVSHLNPCNDTIIATYLNENFICFNINSLLYLSTVTADFGYFIQLQTVHE